MPKLDGELEVNKSFTFDSLTKQKGLINFPHPTQPYRGYPVPGSHWAGTRENTK